MTEHLNKRFKEILTEMNDPDMDPQEIVFHSLRHTYAVIFARNQPIIGGFSHIHRHYFVVYAQQTDEKTVKEAQKSCFWFARDIRG